MNASLGWHCFWQHVICRSRLRYPECRTTPFVTVLGKKIFSAIRLWLLHRYSKPRGIRAQVNTSGSGKTWRTDLRWVPSFLELPESVQVTSELHRSHEFRKTMLDVNLIFLTSSSHTRLTECSWRSSSCWVKRRTRTSRTTARTPPSTLTATVTATARQPSSRRTMIWSSLHWSQSSDTTWHWMSVRWEWTSFPNERAAKLNLLFQSWRLTFRIVLVLGFGWLIPCAKCHCRIFLEFSPPLFFSFAVPTEQMGKNSVWIQNGQNDKITDHRHSAIRHWRSQPVVWFRYRTCLFLIERQNKTVTAIIKKYTYVHM